MLAAQPKFDLKQIFFAVFTLSLGTTLQPMSEALEPKNLQKMELEQVFVVMRHGARTPVDIFPSDPNQAKDWPSPPGKLTDAGLMQHFQLGQFFRRHYIEKNKFLNPIYKSEEIFIRSTDYDRTIRSALANMAGMYPAAPNSSLPLVPVTIHSTDKLHDVLMAYWNSCPKLSFMVDEIFKEDQEIQDFKSQHKDEIEFIRKKSGWKRDFRSMWKIGDCLKAERENNLPWAPWVNQTLYDILIDIEILNFKAYSYNWTMQRFTAGNMLQDIHAKIQKKIKGEEIEKMHVYSGHDTSVIATMAPLEVWNKLKVPYAGYVALELVKDPTDGRRYIQIYVRNDTSSMPVPKLTSLPFCGNDSSCPWETFEKFIKRFFIADWKEECQLNPDDKTTEERFYDSLVTALSVVITLLVLIIIAMTGIFLKYRRTVQSKVDHDLTPLSSEI